MEYLEGQEHLLDRSVGEISANQKSLDKSMTDLSTRMTGFESRLGTVDRTIEKLDEKMQTQLREVTSTVKGLSEELLGRTDRPRDYGKLAILSDQNNALDKKFIELTKKMNMALWGLILAVLAGSFTIIASLAGVIHFH